MTSFGQLNRALVGRKLRLVTRAILIELIALVVTLLVEFFTKATSLTATDVESTIGGLGVIFWVVLTIFLTRDNEFVLISSATRLIPVSDTKLYSTNLFTTMLAWGYAMVLQAVLHGIGIALDWQSFINDFGRIDVSGTMKLPPVWVIVLVVIVMMIAAVILFFTSVSLIHLVIMAITVKLPVTGQRFVRLGLYIVVIWAVVRVAGVAFGLYGNLVDGINLSSGYVQVIGSLIGMLLFAAIEAAVSVWLMKRWVEAVI
ncbi:hypothetical protein [Secundilactobacillus similis]|uniref:Uncharacterized protein n=1 Tax=Secundilactobacillus similis DSM 23365 = JCM 2765 TaxID=1423804 RepID=A0A0R2F8R8_9LACO|nr:hypothetical protein [Secundilactobacillus similis]KRN21754.1 hypothetical protein FD14_GL000935 [Secundilactobacillus similis DSM 23365 = JCM 2765]